MIALLLLAGCAPGTLASPFGSEPLRTALFATEADGVSHLLLSNGQLACDLPDHSDPIEQQLALADLQFAACREGAKHLFVDLEPGDGMWTQDNASAVWISVHEASVVNEDGLTRALVVTDWTIDWEALADGGALVIEQATDGWSGTFHLPAVQASGDFRAAECPADSALFDLLIGGPVVACP